ncbi:MAG: hypothetical protein PF508_14920 [Spirochaeta sp.]|jgi:hypothetical protein|nr:hypothetical protein [Spirochaeta sp.]
MNARTRSSKRRRPLFGRARVITVLVLTVAVMAGAVFVFRTELATFFFSRTVRSGSQGTLVELRDLAELETLAYVRRTVFPHDYLSAETDMTRIVQRLSTDGGPPEEVLSATELQHYRAANLASDIGLATRREQSGYVVITVVYRFGYDIAELTDRLNAYLATTPGTEIADAVPEAVVLSVDVEDLHRETYPYGTVSLDAEGVRRVATFVADQDIPADVLSELKAESRTRAVEIIRRLTGKS